MDRDTAIVILAALCLVIGVGGLFVLAGYFAATCFPPFVYAVIGKTALVLAIPVIFYRLLLRAA
jgi:hypothetical protein